MADLTAEVAEEVGKLKKHLTETHEKAIADLERKVSDKVDPAIKSEIKKVTELLTEKEKSLNDHVSAIDVKLQKIEKGGGTHSGTFVDHMIKTFEKEGFNVKTYADERGRKGKNFAFDELTAKSLFFNPVNKAVGTMTQANSITGELPGAQYHPSIIEQVDRKTHIRSLLPQGTMSSDTYRVPKETGGEGGVDVTGEAEAKNQVDFDLQTYDYPARKITGYVKSSEELLDDVTGLATFIRGRLLNKMRNKEDQQLIYGTGLSNQLTGLTQTSGVGSFTAYYADSNATILDLILALTGQQMNAEYSVNGVVLSPKDYITLLVTKATTGEYIGDKFYNIQTQRMEPYGVSVFTNTVINNGEYIAGDWVNGAMIMDKMGVNIRVYDQNEDDAIKNIITILAEQRLALPVFYDAAFVTGTITTDIDKIKNYT